MPAGINKSPALNLRGGAAATTCNLLLQQPSNSLSFFHRSIKKSPARLPQAGLTTNNNDTWSTNLSQLVSL
jgi:hypothetical protein